MTLPRDLASENEQLALRWAGPFGYAVLQTLRRSDVFAEADFADFVRRAPTREVEAPERTVVRGPPTGGEGPIASVQKDGLAVEPERVTTVSMRPLEPSPPPEFYRPAQAERTRYSPSGEPAPPAAFYRRATRTVPTPGRPGAPPPPPGRRDASGRYVRPAR